MTCHFSVLSCLSCPLPVRRTYCAERRVYGSDYVGPSLTSTIFLDAGHFICMRTCRRLSADEPTTKTDVSFADSGSAHHQPLAARLTCQARLVRGHGGTALRDSPWQRNHLPLAGYQCRSTFESGPLVSRTESTGWSDRRDLQTSTNKWNKSM